MRRQRNQRGVQKTFVMPDKRVLVTIGVIAIIVIVAITMFFRSDYNVYNTAYSNVQNAVNNSINNIDQIDDQILINELEKIGTIEEGKVSEFKLSYPVKVKISDIELYIFQDKTIANVSDFDIEEEKYIINEGETITPFLLEGMIPVVIDELWTVSKSGTNSSGENSWYNYDEKQWANMVIVKEDKREYYLNSEVGTEILEEDILQYYTWVPRFKYEIYKQGPMQELNIEFENANTDKSTGVYEGEWKTHPVFTTSDGEELAGIWVAKFEYSHENNMTIGTEQIINNVEVELSNGLINKNNKELLQYSYLNAENYENLINSMTIYGNIFGLNNNVSSEILTDDIADAIYKLTLSKSGDLITSNTESTTANNSGIFNLPEMKSSDILSETVQIRLNPEIDPNVQEETANQLIVENVEYPKFTGTEINIKNVIIAESAIISGVQTKPVAYGDIEFEIKENEDLNEESSEESSEDVIDDTNEENEEQEDVEYNYIVANDGIGKFGTLELLSSDRSKFIYKLDNMDPDTIDIGYLEVENEKFTVNVIENGTIVGNITISIEITGGLNTMIGRGILYFN